MADVELQHSPPPQSPEQLPSHTDDESANDESGSDAPVPSESNDGIASHSNNGPPADEGEPPAHEDESVEDPSQSASSVPPTEPSAAVSTASRDRASSTSTAATVDPGRSATKTSLVFVVGALETILASKDCQRNKRMKESTEQALNAIRTIHDPAHIDPAILFAPLKATTEEASSDNVVVAALDCLGKLISYSYFSLPPSDQSHGDRTQPDSLIDQAIDTICSCFEGDATTDRVQLQIIISLLAAVLNDKVVVHGAGLLKAIRQMYNIFLYSKNSRTQQVAQGTLTQMVGTVLERAGSRVAAREARMKATSSPGRDANGVEKPNGDGFGAAKDSVDPGDDSAIADDGAAVPVAKDASHKITLKSFERRASFDEGLQEGPTVVTRVGTSGSAKRGAAGQDDDDAEDGAADEDEDDEDEDTAVYLKDAFLVFRAMCKISIKPLPASEVVDPRSQGMRAKLLSLHIIHTVLFNNIPLFLSPHAIVKGSFRDPDATTFLQAIKQPLCQSLSRNGASSVNRVYETGCEIFFMMIKHLRVVLKKEVEVFLKEIYLAILDNRNAPAFQKQCFLNVLQRLAVDPRALVEIYLNYDCDRTASDNMFQRIVEHIARISSTPVPLTALQAQSYQEKAAKKHALQDWQLRGILPSSLTVPPPGSLADYDPTYPLEFSMKTQSLDCVIDVLRSMVHWAQKTFDPSVVPANASDADFNKFSAEDLRESIDNRSPYIGGVDTQVSTPVAEDDPSQLEKAKQRKTALTDAIRQFNFKPKRGLKTLLNGGFIKSSSPTDIAEFLTSNPQLSKAAVGEFLGEGDPENVAIMHAFVDAMDFHKTRFVDAVRRFLQSFRLPGEAQKIDRYMLKFAERYMVGNPNAFANADTAYVLAYSVIMLNTDQHSAKVKGNRMTPEDFIKNNRGINDNKDLPEDYLRGIYDEIQGNEIVLNTERETAANLGFAPQPPAGGLAMAFANVGRDLQREAYMARAEEMANKTEQLFKSLMRAQRKVADSDELPVKFIPATSFKHIGPMFDVTWMPFLTALSGYAQNTTNMETVRVCMDGMKLAIQISCLFDLENPRQAFVSYLARFTNLYNLREMQGKNVEALRVLLDVAYSEGNSLKESWREVLTVVSQLDRFQLISEGVDEKALPDVLRPQPSNQKGNRQSQRQPRPSAGGASGTNYRPDIAEEARGSEIVNGVDRLFTSTSRLSGDAIVDFVKALTQVSWQEIESSGQSQDPRTFSLQKLVEVSEYNMDRVRFEWTAIWQVLGEHFNEVGINANTKVVHFVLNSLRQLAVRFLDLEELPGFKFQKDFLKPFEQIMANSTSVQVKEIVLHSLAQLLQARGNNIRSGWRTIFGVFAAAAREPYEGVVNLAYDVVIQVYDQRFGTIIVHGALADLMVCLTTFSKNTRFQKRSLQAIEVLKASIPKMLKTPECPLSSKPSAPQPRQPSKQTLEEQYWWPVLFSFHDVIMTGEDLEVRSRALNYLFDALTKYGYQFPREFWDTIWRQLLYTIFMVLKSKSELTKMVNHEELAVWLSTTMVQALRNIMSLFTHYFEALEYMLDRCLDLLALCICQENDTLARIGSNCLQSLIMSNVEKFSADHWAQIVDCFIELFNNTEATALFSAAASYSSSSAPSTNGAEGKTKMPSGNDLRLNDDALSERRPSTSSGSRLPSPLGSNRKGEVTSPTFSSSSQALEEFGRPESAAMQAQPPVVTAARRRFFNKIITQCVLQLLMIETVNELFSNDRVYSQIPSDQLLRLMVLLKKSYQFAKRFNDDLELRNRLFAEGFMKQPPNLLKQESGSASVYVNILFRMYHDTGEERVASRGQTEAALIPLCTDIMHSFAALNADTQQRNIITWRPVVIDVIDGYTNFASAGFAKHAPAFAPFIPKLMGREMGHELQRSVQVLSQRVLELHYEMPTLDGWLIGVPPSGSAPPTPVSASPASTSTIPFGGRRRMSRTGT